MPPHLVEAVEIFCSYAHKDETLREQLQAHLSSLKHEGKIKHWHDRLIQPGENWQGKIDEHLERAHIILLLISADFIKSDYCHEVEMQRAMQRYRAKEARVIPIILRPCDWENSPFGELQALPEGALPVIEWPTTDAAFTNVAKSIRSVVDDFLNTTPTTTTPPPQDAPSLRPPATGFVARRDKQGCDIVEYVMKLPEFSKHGGIALWGKGGVGKSTLAVEIARKWVESCGGRVVLSRAEKKADYTLRSLLKDIIEQLGQQPDIPPLQLRARKARAYALVEESPTLILLDTYEKIAPDARHRITEWLDHARCVKLFTSHEEIRSIPNITIDPMTPAEARELIARLTSHSESKDRFTDDICRRIYEATEGRPYLIVWVVEEITGGSVPKKVFKELRQGRGDAAERIFNRYFNLPQLGGGGRTALLALSLFVPHATRYALAAVAGFPDDETRLRKVIENLLKLKLIKGDDQNENFALEGLPLDMVAARLPKSNYAAGIWRRFVTYFRDQALTHPKYDWATPEDPDRPRAEKSNIIRAIQVAPCIKDWDTVVALYDSWVDFMRVSFKAWATAIWLAEEYAEQKIRLQSTLTPLMIEIHHQDKEKARKHYEAIGAKLDEGRRWKRVVLSGVKFELGVFACHRGDYTLARKLLEEAQTLQEKINHKFGVGMTCNNLGVVLAMQGERAEAEVKFRAALDIFTSESQRPDSLKAKGRHGETLCNFEGLRPYEKRRSPFGRWSAAVANKILYALFNIKPFGSTQQKGARFAKAVRLNLKWLDRQ